MSLSSHFNVWDTCLHILRECGYAIQVQGVLDEDGSWPTEVMWIAEKDGFMFKAENPIELLGLKAIYDHVQPEKDVSYWWKSGDGDLRKELMLTAFPEPKNDQ
jgi:hypothetical protein